MKKLLLALNLVFLFVLLVMPLQASAAERIGATYYNGDVWLKEGGYTSGWRQLTSGVNVGNLSLSGDRMTLLNQGDGTASIKEPAWNSPWEWTYYGSGQPLATKALASQLSNGQYRLLILRADGSVIMKDGPYNTGWWSGTIEPNNVSDIVVGGNRIGVIMSNGDFKVKQLTPGQFSHPNNVSWDLEATGVNAGKAALTNNRIAYVDSSNNLYAKEGGTTAPWFGSIIFSYASTVRLAANRVCSLQTGVYSGTVFCKDGSFDRVPVQVYSNDTVDMEVSATRVVVSTSGNIAKLLEGSIYGANSGWQNLGTGVSGVELNN